MDLRKLKLLNKKTCCGYEFTAKDITSLFKNDDYRFYGGRIEYYSTAKCPKCGQEVVLLLEAYDNSYRIVDIGINTKITASQAITMIDKAVKELTKKDEIMPSMVSFVCPNCKKEFKTKAGLGKHIKSCK